VENPTNKHKAFKDWLKHPDVIESMKRDRSGRKKEIYDDIKMAVQTGAMKVINESLSDKIENLLRIYSSTAS